jgi:guanylate kinase
MREKTIRKPGRIVVISSPSGGGKTSICRKLLSPTRRRQGWALAVSYTTRRRREGERHGRHYYFVSEAEFKRRVNEDFFAEHFKVHLYNYGTPRGPLERVRQQGGVIILDVDVNGARRLHREYPDATSIFILPPSIAALKRRLKLRGTETREQLSVRFENAKREMQQFQRHGFDYVVVNKELEVAVQQVLHIIEADACRIKKIPSEQIRKITG